MSMSGERGEDGAGAVAEDEAMMEWMEEPVRWLDTPDELCAWCAWEAGGGLEGMVAGCEGERLMRPACVLDDGDVADADAEDARPGEWGWAREGEEEKSREMRFVVCTLSPFSCSARRRSLTLEAAGSSPSARSRSLLRIEFRVSSSS